MSTELYLDTARLGRMCRGARSAEQEFGRLVGRLGSSLYLERFLAHGCGALPEKVRRRFSRLDCWPGMTGFQAALGRFVRQPAGLPVCLFSQSSSLIHFAGSTLFSSARRVLATDLAWPAYLAVLRRMARATGRRLHIVPLRRLVMSDGATSADVVRYLGEAFETYDCDGLFVSDVTYLGVRLPLERLLDRLSAASTCFVVVDGAQAFAQRAVDLSQLKADLYLAGTQKWFGAYHPLRVAFTGRRSHLDSIQRTLRNRSLTDGSKDALFDFCQAVRLNRFPAFGETVNVSPLIAAAGVLQPDADRDSQQVNWKNLCRNAQNLADWLGDHGCRPFRLHESLASGILLLHAAKLPGKRFAYNARCVLARHGLVASAFPEGLVRLSMPRHDLPDQQRSFIARALHRAFR